MVDPFTDTRRSLELAVANRSSSRNDHSPIEKSGSDCEPVCKKLKDDTDMNSNSDNPTQEGRIYKDEKKISPEVVFIDNGGNRVLPSK